MYQRLRRAICATDDDLLDFAVYLLLLGRALNHTHHRAHLD